MGRLRESSRSAMAQYGGQYAVRFACIACYWLPQNRRQYAVYATYALLVLLGGGVRLVLME